MAKQELRAIISADARAFLRTMKTVRGVALESAKWIGGAAAAGAAAYGYAVKSTANELDKLAKQQARTGADIGWLQRFTYAADLSDASAEGLGKAMKKLQDNLGQAQNGSKSVGEAFRLAGMDARLLARMTPTQAMDAVLERLADMSDLNQRATATNALLGKSGSDLLPMLKGGAAGYRGLLAERDKIGPLFTQAQIDGAERFNDSLTASAGQARTQWANLLRLSLTA